MWKGSSSCLPRVPGHDVQHDRMFALQSEGVPVLIGMRELMVMNAFTESASERRVINNNMVELR